ncbi:restriction system-associated AAA family ATPase [Photobacterium phosphoreum]|uniref:restriction system-associated AAA family ATPase n=1 Tax=Photobacterium phosphoreum TaxID=659 RepID=UPI001E43761D|nr:restriction system-associated AAA family ATPase [Photobacterium phosphoreum]MCD9510449.1 restriction system-associated AAA family ATPase [Photobacterium phosphoreum]
MKLIRLKITDKKGFRSLQAGFEYVFRSEWALQDELSEQPQFSDKGFAPFVCAGPNGSGKSNLLEVLSAIFYHLECMYLDNLPSTFGYDEENNRVGFRSDIAKPDGFEIEYLMPIGSSDVRIYAHVLIIKKVGESPNFQWLNRDELYNDHNPLSGDEIKQLLPEFVLGYSSGENEVLSLPFFKMRFFQFDEYWNALRGQFSYSGRPETRMAYMDNTYSQAILLCNLLYNEVEARELFELDMGLGALHEFRIVIKRSIEISPEQVELFGLEHPALTFDEERNRYTLNIVNLLEADETSSDRFGPMITRLKRCATCYFLDENTDSLYLDYCVNSTTRKAFSENFSFEVNKSPIELFQTFQVLLSLNLYTVSEQLKSDLYQSGSLYVNETVPTLASDERIMRFKNFWFNKKGIAQPVLLKSLSDGEHQLLHSLGLCLLFKDTNSLFLLDEPETHFNPAWRSNFISRLRSCFPEKNEYQASHEMLITTHTPFLISDSERHKVMIFHKDKDSNQVTIKHPDYKTLGASINKITIETFGKHETIGGYAHKLLDDFKEEFKKEGVDIDNLLKRIDNRLGDSVEKLLLMKTIMGSLKERD